MELDSIQYKRHFFKHTKVLVMEPCVGCRAYYMYVHLLRLRIGLRLEIGRTHLQCNMPQPNPHKR